MGVVRQEVKRSAGSLGFMGSTSFKPQATRRMDSSNWPKQLIGEAWERLVEAWLLIIVMNSY